MNPQEIFSQDCIDAIGVIMTVGMLILATLTIFALVYIYEHTTKELRELKKQKLKLEIENLEEAKKFKRSQARLMEEKAKWHEEHRKEQ